MRRSRIRFSPRRTLTLTYKNPDNSTGTVTTTAATTIGGLINAINASGRGLTATFTSAAARGMQAAQPIWAS